LPNAKHFVAGGYSAIYFGYFTVGLDFRRIQTMLGFAFFIMTINVPSIKFFSVFYQLAFVIAPPVGAYLLLNVSPPTSPVLDGLLKGS
jgi:hypothetical protein